MIHPDEGTIQALLDGELEPAARAGTERHLAGCPACAEVAAELRATRDRFRFALRAADIAAPVEPARVGVRRRAADAGRGRALRRGLARAALLVLGVAGIAYASVPGSPVRAWLEGDAPTAVHEPVPALAVETAPPPVVETAASGISIRPEDGRVRVVLSASAPELRVHARVGDGELAVVEATGAAAGARFRTGPGRIEVVGAGPGEVHVVLPRAARTAVVEVNGEVRLLRQGERMQLMGPVEQDDASGVVFRVAP